MLRFGKPVQVVDFGLSVEEKFGEQNFRIFSDMRGEILVYRPYKLKNLNQNWMKMQKLTLPKFEISIFSKFGFEQMRNRTSKPEIRFRF